ncbi:beta-sandwich domain-containing protein [Bdellovibrio sp. 22V]|uniref:beta-sandwich domain-containing protein n=1 Tax=Bdellovibrio TaxID=958 RepID=UPI0025429FF6|nr:beta-sandwich domain-containing protein [Bdellovibrio sp. 22V]WII71252.1 beta-sandwich domain-containing protein [Bdellovibrio sp. 22V]
MKKNLVLGSVIVASLVQYTSPAFANKEIIGNIIGGVIGGAIGTQIGKGNGNKAAIIIGAIAGTMIGGKIGSDLDEADRRALEEAQRRSLQDRLGDRCDWDGRRYGSRTGARGSFTSTREGYNNRTGEYCREYTSVIYAGNRTEETRGVACSRRDGSWYEVRETEVRFQQRGGGSFGNGGGHVRPDPRPERPSRPVPPPPPPSSQGRYEGTTQISSVTRRSGGEWFRITLRRPVSLDRVEVRALSAGVRIHEASVYTVSNRQIRIRELSPTPTFYAGDTAVSESLNSGERIQVIDIRAESMGGSADILVKALSNDDYPSLSVSRY